MVTDKNVTFHYNRGDNTLFPIYSCTRIPRKMQAVNHMAPYEVFIKMKPTTRYLLAGKASKK
jgi:hypothetical protein